MTKPNLAWLFEDPEQLDKALNEQGASKTEIEELSESLSKLGEWQAPAPTALETHQLVEGLLPFVPQPDPVRQAIQAPSSGLTAEFWAMLRLVRTQVTILQPAFWLASALVVLLGGFFLFSAPNLNQAFVLQVIGPMLSYIGTASAFRASGLHMLEFELACPPSPRQLTLARLIVVLSYDLILGLCLSRLLWSPDGTGEMGFWLISLNWLAPLLLGVGLTLLLSLRIPIHQAAGIVYVGWLAILVLSLQGQNTLQGVGATFSQPVELAFGAAGLVCIGLSVAAMPNALPRLFPRH